MKKKLIIMGAGNLGRQVCEEVVPMLVEKYDDICLFDNDGNKQGKTIKNYMVIGKKELLELCKYMDCSIIIATEAWKELYLMCCEMGIEEKVVAVCNQMFFEIKQYRLGRFSQDGEEIYLSSVFSACPSKKGFYVDVGAHHPFRFSNTYWAYKKGWNGINIEPNEEMYHLFEENRKRDININCGISSSSGELTYYKFEEPAYNTFVKEEFEGIREPKEKKQVSVRRLDEILDEYDVKEIDFLNIDVEGLEMEVLQSNNWEKYVPTYILLEQKTETLEQVFDTAEYRFLSQFGYKCVWKGLWTAIYKKCSI